MGWPWTLGYRFYMDTAEDKDFSVKIHYARMPAYILPYSVVGDVAQPTMVLIYMLLKILQKRVQKDLQMPVL